ncbi:MAG: hypothetical protein QXW65_02650 [Candidatus Pacearchaeota archaeon]
MIDPNNEHNKKPNHKNLEIKLALLAAHSAISGFNIYATIDHVLKREFFEASITGALGIVNAILAYYLGNKIVKYE